MIYMAFFQGDGRETMNADAKVSLPHPFSCLLPYLTRLSFFRHLCYTSPCRAEPRRALPCRAKPRLMIASMLCLAQPYLSHPGPARLGLAAPHQTALCHSISKLTRSNLPMPIARALPMPTNLPASIITASIWPR